MPYVTGSANNMAGLLSALQGACTANGWTLSGNVLHKGTCYQEAVVGTTIGTGAPVNGYLFLRAGNGIDGGNALTDPAPLRSNIGILKAATGSAFPDWDWPVTYQIHVHAAPDEVWMAVNYDAAQRWQHLGFGQSPVSGNAGSGNWHFASVRDTSAPSAAPRINDAVISPGGANDVWSSDFCPAPFFQTDMGSGGRCNSFVHGAIHSVSGAAIWSDADQVFGTGSNEGRVSANVTIRPLLSRSPNAWNNETILCPVLVLQARPELKSSLIAELAHSRYCRNDFIEPGGVIQLGPDRWKVYPCYRKDVAQRNGLSTGFNGRIDHSGTVAMAVRYDGP